MPALDVHTVYKKHVKVDVAPRTVTGTKSAFFETERHQALGVAGAAPHTKKSGFQPSATKKVLELPPDGVQQHPASAAHCASKAG